MSKYKKQWIRAPTVKTIYSCESLEMDSKTTTINIITEDKDYGKYFRTCRQENRRTEEE